MRTGLILLILYNARPYIVELPSSPSRKKLSGWYLHQIVMLRSSNTWRAGSRSDLKGWREKALASETTSRGIFSRYHGGIGTASSSGWQICKVVAAIRYDKASFLIVQHVSKTCLWKPPEQTTGGKRRSYKLCRRNNDVSCR